MAFIDDNFLLESDSAVRRYHACAAPQPGNEMEKALLPSDEALVGTMVSDICFNNAERYFALPSTSNKATLLDSSYSSQGSL